MRYLIYFLFLTPLSVSAQEGSVEYVMQSDFVFPSTESIMENLPDGLNLDTSMIQMGRQFMDSMPPQITKMIMYYSGDTSLMEMKLGNLPMLPPNSGPLAAMPIFEPMVFIDHSERTQITTFPSFNEGENYVITQQFNPIEWLLIDADSTLLDLPVKKAQFTSDTLDVIAWYTPEIQSDAGPPNFSGLPGLPLLLQLDSSMMGFQGRFTYTAVKLTDGLEEKLSPPEGIPITPEEFTKRMSEILNQFTPQAQ